MILYKKAQQGTPDDLLEPKQYSLEPMQSTSPAPKFNLYGRPPAPISQSKRINSIPSTIPPSGIIQTPQEYNPFPMIPADRGNMHNYTTRFNLERKKNYADIKEQLKSAEGPEERRQINDDLDRFKTRTEEMRSWLNNKYAEELAKTGKR